MHINWWLLLMTIFQNAKYSSEDLYKKNLFNDVKDFESIVEPNEESNIVQNINANKVAQSKRIKGNSQKLLDKISGSPQKVLVEQHNLKKSNDYPDDKSYEAVADEKTVHFYKKPVKTNAENILFQPENAPKIGNWGDPPLSPEVMLPQNAKETNEVKNDPKNNPSSRDRFYNSKKTHNFIDSDKDQNSKTNSNYDLAEAGGEVDIENGYPPNAVLTNKECPDCGKSGVACKEEKENNCESSSKHTDSDRSHKETGCNDNECPTNNDCGGSDSNGGSKIDCSKPNTKQKLPEFTKLNKRSANDMKLIPYVLVKELPDRNAEVPQNLKSYVIKWIGPNSELFNKDDNFYSVHPESNNEEKYNFDLEPMSESRRKRHANSDKLKDLNEIIRLLDKHSFGSHNLEYIPILFASIGEKKLTKRSECKDEPPTPVEKAPSAPVVGAAVPAGTAEVASKNQVYESKKNKKENESKLEVVLDDAKEYLKEALNLFKLNDNTAKKSKRSDKEAHENEDFKAGILIYPIAEKAHNKHKNVQKIKQHSGENSWLNQVDLNFDPKLKKKRSILRNRNMFRRRHFRDALQDLKVGVPLAESQNLPMLALSEVNGKNKKVCPDPNMPKQFGDEANDVNQVNSNQNKNVYLQLMHKDAEKRAQNEKEAKSGIWAPIQWLKDKISKTSKTIENKVLNITQTKKPKKREVQKKLLGPYLEEEIIDNRIKSLETDLKLVNEVQDIIAKSINRRKKREQDAGLRKKRSIDEEEEDLPLPIQKFRIKKRDENMYFPPAKALIRKSFKSLKTTDRNSFLEKDYPNY